MKTIIFAAIAAVLLWLFVFLEPALAVAAKPSAMTPVANEDVRIGVSCGTLRGSGAIIIADFGTGQTHQLHFTCPMD
jgi:hypothetical protein